MFSETCTYLCPDIKENYNDFAVLEKHCMVFPLQCISCKREVFKETGKLHLYPISKVEKQNWSFPTIRLKSIIVVVKMLKDFF